MKFPFLLCCFLFGCCNGWAQLSKPFIKLINPYTNEIKSTSTRQFISGSTCKTCSITINSQPIKVYPTGAFVAELNLGVGDTTMIITASLGKENVKKQLVYHVQPMVTASPVQGLDIQRIDIFPKGDLVVQPGDEIRFRVKALPNAVVKALNDVPLYELPAEQANGMRGIYQGTYRIQETDSFLHDHIPFTLTDSTGKTIRQFAESSISLLSESASTVALTKGRLAHLEYGLGNDRLGGAKVGYLDSNIVLQICGKVGSHFKVQLTPTRTAYIPEELVELQPRGIYAPQSLTDKWTVYGDSLYDYVKVGLFARLPYQSFQLTDPSRIVVDVFGATNNTNWITQLSSAKEIASVQYEQVEDELFRITIQLQHRQHWGHLLYYQGNSLIIQVRRPPLHLSLKGMVIGVDAGHGGINNGAVGPTGVYEKELTLAIALQLEQALKKEGAQVIMTRNKEQFFDNKERILFYRDSLPQLLLSIHLNSSEDPIHVGGTSTFYRYPGFKALSGCIYQKLLELGLKEYGHNGSFNFMLNSPTEYPNALIETLFLSNPEEEMKILDPVFQKQLVNKIVDGLKLFLATSE